MIKQPTTRLALLLLLFIVTILSSLVTCNNNSSSGGGVTIKARVIVPKSEIAHGVRVMLNHADTFYVNKDGSFELTNLSPGIHMIDVISTHYIYPQIRIDVSSKSNKARAFRLVPRASNPMTSEDLTYMREPLSVNPLIQIVPLTEAQYFEKREPFSVLPLLKNPMVLMLIVGVGMAYIFPKVVDPEAMKEAQATLSSSESEFKNLLGGLKGEQPPQQPPRK